MEGQGVEGDSSSSSRKEIPLFPGQRERRILFFENSAEILSLSSFLFFHSLHSVSRHLPSLKSKNEGERSSQANLSLPPRLPSQYSWKVGGGGGPISLSPYPKKSSFWKNIRCHFHYHLLPCIFSFLPFYCTLSSLWVRRHMERVPIDDAPSCANAYKQPESY